MTEKSWKTIFSILLSMLVMTWTGGCRQEPKASVEEDLLQKGRRLFVEQEFEEAYGSFRAAWLLAVTCEPNPDRALEALIHMGECTFWMGEVDSCIYRYNQALVLAREQNKQYEEYEICCQLKQAYMLQANMEQVMLLIGKIDSLMAVSKDVRIQIGARQRLAQEALQQQNLRLAEHYYKCNEALLDSLPIDQQQSMQSVVYGNLRDFYFNQQYYEKAREYVQKEIAAVKSEFKQPPMGYMLYGIEALACAHLKNRKSSFMALDSMKYGLTLKDEDNPSFLLTYHETRGRVHAILGEWEKACNEFKKALEAAEGTDIVGRASYYQVGRLWGDALCQLKKYDEARGAYCLYWEYCKYQYGEVSMACADILIALAHLERQCGETRAGKQYYMKAVEICQEIVNKQLRYVSIQERNAFWNIFAPCMFTMSAYALNMGETQSLFTEKCYEALLFSKALLLESDRTLAMLVENDGTPEEKRLYYEMQGLQNQLKGLMNSYERNKLRIDTLHRKISEQNKRLTPVISRLGYTSFLSLGYQDVKLSLKEDEVLLDFTDFKSDEKVQQFAAFVVDRKQEHPKLVKSFTEEEIKRLLAEAPKSKPYYLYMEPYASKALKMIWKPLANEVKGKKTIYYVPSGILHRIALESLPLGDGSLLGEHYNFVRLTSAREIIKIKGGTPIAQNGAATLYGALKYDMDTVSMSHEASRYNVVSLLSFRRGTKVRGNKPWDELPNTKEEIDKIEIILKRKHLNVTARTGIKGTQESFFAMSGKAPQILHVATHGFYYNTPEDAKDISYLKGYNDAMQLSGLILSGGNLAWTGKHVPQGVLEGVLTANDIASMNLRGTDLVVLSACQTGLGVATSEGVYGLQRAFKKAGAQTIVMSLWSVDDEATKDFMIKFYEELADSPNKWDKRKAFEKAKAFVRSKTYMRKGTAYKGDPFFWAGFVMLD